MPNIFNRSRAENNSNADWRDLDALPKEVISKSELDNLQKEVVSELGSLQAETISQAEGNMSAQPQALYYYHKYIDAKFDKSDFDVDTYFIKKQNIIDQKYAEGLGDLRGDFTGYKELLDQIHEVDKRLRRKVNKLDPDAKIDVNAPGTYDDSAALLAQIEKLPEEIDWKSLREANK